MRRIYLVVSVLLTLAAVFHNRIHFVAAALTLVLMTQGFGRMRLWGKVAGGAYFAVAIAGLIWSDLFGLMRLTPYDTVLHFAVAIAFLYVGLLAPPR